MLEVLIIISILGCLLSIGAISIALIALLKTMANERATHTVQMEPLSKNPAEQAFDFEPIEEEEEDPTQYQEIPSKDLEKMLLKGL